MTNTPTLDDDFKRALMIEEDKRDFTLEMKSRHSKEDVASVWMAVKMRLADEDKLAEKLLARQRKEDKARQLAFNL